MEETFVHRIMNFYVICATQKMLSILLKTLDLLSSIYYSPHHNRADGDVIITHVFIASLTGPDALVRLLITNATVMP